MEAYTVDAHMETYVNSPFSLGDRVLQRQKLKSPLLRTGAIKGFHFEVWRRSQYSCVCLTYCQKYVLFMVAFRVHSASFSPFLFNLKVTWNENSQCRILPEIWFLPFHPDVALAVDWAVVTMNQSVTFEQCLFKLRTTFPFSSAGITRRCTLEMAVVASSAGRWQTSQGVWLLTTGWKTKGWSPVLSVMFASPLLSEGITAATVARSSAPSKCGRKMFCMKIAFNTPVKQLCACTGFFFKVP